MPIKNDFQRLFVICIVLFLVSTISTSSVQGIFSTQTTEKSTLQREMISEFSPQKNELESKVALNFYGSGKIQINSIVLEEGVIVKGENTKITINIESEENIEDISLHLVLESIPSQYGLEYLQDKDKDNELESLKLDIVIVDFCESLVSNVAFEKSITFGPNLEEGVIGVHSLQPLNRGSWRFTTIQFTSSADDSLFEFEDNLEVHVTLNPDEHVVFAYFVHNNIEPFFNGRTIRDSVDQAFDRLENNYSFSYQIEVLAEDNEWAPDSSLIESRDLIADAWGHVGKQLELKDDSWDHLHGFDLVESLWTTTKPLNGGYDILLIVSDRPGEVLGLAAYCGNWAYASGGRYDALNYHTSSSQYDNIIQHEVSHIFGAADRADSDTLMDNTLSFNGTHYTSPCLEETNYLSVDINQMKTHAERFDGSLNPTIPYTLGREKILSSIDNTLWINPSVAQSKNSSYPIVHSVAGLKNAQDKIILYHSSYYNNLWTAYSQFSALDQNASLASSVVDAYGNLHVVWIVHNTSEIAGHLYYRNRTYSGTLSAIEILETNTTQDCKISADGLGNVFLIFAQGNETHSKLFYRTKNNSNWSAKETLITDTTNARKAAITFDLDNNLHLFWYERNSPSSENKLYYNILDNSSSFGLKEILLTETSNEHLEELQVSIAIASRKVSFLWEEIDESQRSLYYTEKYTNGTLGSIDLLFSDSESKSTHPLLTSIPDDRILVLWEDLNKYKNQTYLLFRSKEGDTKWSYINRFSPLEISTSYPTMIYDDENEEFILLFSTNDYSYTYSKFYSRIIFRKFYPENYQISVADFNFTAEIDSNSGSIIFTFSNIQASSNFTDIGILDEESKTIVHSFGIMRRDEALPLYRGSLSLNTYSDTWFGSAVVSDVEPGEFYVAVAFMDSEYTYSGQFNSINVFIIEEPESPRDTTRILIISLSIGIPVILTGIILPTILVLRKKKKKSLTAS